MVVYADCSSIPVFDRQGTCKHRQSKVSSTYSHLTVDNKLPGQVLYASTQHRKNGASKIAAGCTLLRKAPNIQQRPKMQPVHTACRLLYFQMQTTCLLAANWFCKLQTDGSRLRTCLLVGFSNFPAEGDDQCTISTWSHAVVAATVGAVRPCWNNGVKAAVVLLQWQTEGRCAANSAQRLVCRCCD
jgi:hypothetical protein